MCLITVEIVSKLMTTVIARAVGEKEAEGIAAGPAREMLASLLTDSGWLKALDGEFRKEYMVKIVNFLHNETKKVNPGCPGLHP